jgi:large subunit ribosomal protein L20
MVRVKRGVNSKRRHNKTLSSTKGYWGTRSRLYKRANEAAMRAGQYQYRDRRNRKREMRKLWIQRINAASRQHGLPYNQLISGLTQAGVEVDRKMLADLAVRDPEAFGEFVTVAREAL